MAYRDDSGNYYPPQRQPRVPVPPTSLATLPTGAVTGDDDPRLRDAQHGNDKEVLDYLNRPGGPGDPTLSQNPKQFASAQVAGNHRDKSYYTNAPAVDPRVNQLTQDYIKSQGLTGNQSDPAALNRITEYLRSQGINAQTDFTDENGHTGGIVVDGHPYQLLDGSNNWTPLQAWQDGAGDIKPAGAQMAGLAPTAGRYIGLDSLGADTTPGGYSDRQRLIYELQQRLANGGA